MTDHRDTSGISIPLGILRRILVEHFDKEELSDLCLDLGVEYDDLPGDSKAAKARGLVTYLHRRDRVWDLVEVGERVRPEIRWSEAYLNGHMEQYRLKRDRIDRDRRLTREGQRVVNLRPLLLSTYRNRLREIQALCDCLASSNVRLISITGRGGMGKTALASHVLAKIEEGVLPLQEDVQSLAVDGIVYLNSRSAGFGLERIYDDVGRMLGEPLAGQLAVYWAQKNIPLTSKIEYLLQAMRDGLYVILLDNLESVLTEGGVIVEEGLRLFVECCATRPSGVRLVITSREQVSLESPTALHNARFIALREGLPEDDAVALLRGLDPQGELGLRNAPEEDLRRASRLTGGIPRALEYIAGILYENRATNLGRLLDNDKLFDEQVVEKLVAEGFRCLGENERRVMEALSVFDRPVEEVAVAYLLHPWYPNLDWRTCLRHLATSYFVGVNRVTGEYSLHPLDREYAYRGLSEEESDSYSRWALELRAASFYASTRKSEDEWRTIGDLSPQLLECEHRIHARDYDGACRVLDPIDYPYLYRWGHYTLVIELREKLLGRLSDRRLQALNLGNLGHAYQALGNVRRAIQLQEEALDIARMIDDRQYVCFFLANLGRAYRNSGQIEPAIRYHEEALAIARQVGDRREEGVNLDRLGVIYRDLGQFERAIALYREALSIAREIGNRTDEQRRLGELGSAYRRLGLFQQALDLHLQAVDIARETGDLRHEGIWMNSLGLDYCALGQFERAIDFHTQALTIAQRTNDQQREGHARTGLSRALLGKGQLAEARQHSEAVLRLNVPMISYRAALILGITLLRQRDLLAKRAFGQAIQSCQNLLASKADLYDPHYVLATAQVGIVVCDPAWMEEDRRAALLAPALAEYRRALAGSSTPDVVNGVVRELEWMYAAGVEGLDPIFDLLRQATEGDTKQGDMVTDQLTLPQVRK